MEKELVIPAQIRAGRALLGWSQEDLARAAEVGLSTIREFEGLMRWGAVDGSAAMQRALENHGVVFVPAKGDDGPGVRLVGKRPNIIRKPTRMNGYWHLPFAVEWRGQHVIVLVPRDVLDDLDRASGRRSDAEFVASFERHKAAILSATASAVGSGRVAPDGKLHLVSKDFPELR